MSINPQFQVLLDREHTTQERFLLLHIGARCRAARRDVITVGPGDSDSSLLIGVASSLHYVNQFVRQIAFSTQLGSYEVPILAIVRGAVGDAILPDMFRQASNVDDDCPLLWRRSNIAFSFDIIPAFVPLLLYVNVLIPPVLSEKYVASVPLFRVFFLVMLMQRFAFRSPLRAVNHTVPLLVRNFLLVGANPACLIATFHLRPISAIFGPAIGPGRRICRIAQLFGCYVSLTYGVPARDILE